MLSAESCAIHESHLPVDYRCPCAWSIRLGGYSRLE